MKKIVLSLILSIIPFKLSAATYYMATNGSDATGDGSSGNPVQYTTKAVSLMIGGDVLIFKDGTYDYTNISTWVNGTAAAPTIFKAENDGGAIIDGNGVRAGITIGTQQSTAGYVQVEGFYVRNTSNNSTINTQSADATLADEWTHNITFKRVGAIGNRSNNSHVFVFARTRLCLAEDVWAAGEGRYTFQVYSSSNMTVRRLVARWDGMRAMGSGGETLTNPKFNFAVYNVRASTFENIMAIDSSGTLLSGDHGGVDVIANDNPSTSKYNEDDQNMFLGMLVLKSSGGAGMAMDPSAASTNDGNQIIDSVFWANAGTGFVLNRNSSKTFLFHCTMASTTLNGANSGRGASLGSTNLWFSSMSSCLISSNSGHGVNGGWSSNYMNVFGNLGSAYANGASAGPQSIASATYRLYITSGVAGNANDGKASDGSYIGADVTRRYVDGIKTADSLWPWPNESRIKTELCYDAEVNTKGFCADTTSQPITNYVWNMLGNGNPYADPTASPASAEISGTVELQGNITIIIQ